MNITPKTQVNFTYQPITLKKVSLLEKIMEPLRGAVGAAVWRNLGKLNLSQSKKEDIKTNKKDFVIRENAKGLTITVNDPNGQKSHQLDGIAIGQSCTKEPKYTVVFFGLKDNYESHLESMKRLAEDTGTIVVSFNYRGTCESTGSPDGIKDYITDGKAFMEYLSNKEGADPKNILIYGHSLGGGVAVKVKEELNHPGPILSESSFSNFKKAVHDKKGAFTAWVIKKAGWNINTVKALKDIQSGQLGIIVNRRDYVINYKHVSLYQELKKMGIKFDTIKIGTKPQNESFSPAVKISTQKNSKSSPDIKDGYLDLQKNIKNAGWMNYLRNSHQMIMDQPLPNDIAIPDELKKDIKGCSQKEALANNLLNLNKKFAEEDKRAYEGMVKMIKTMLGI
jgi:alpha/beta superfamily hydrolase